MTELIARMSARSAHSRLQPLGPATANDWDEF